MQIRHSRESHHPKFSFQNWWLLHFFFRTISFPSSLRRLDNSVPWRFSGKACVTRVEWNQSKATWIRKKERRAHIVNNLYKMVRLRQGTRERTCLSIHIYPFFFSYPCICGTKQPMGKEGGPMQKEKCSYNMHERFSSSVHDRSLILDATKRKHLKTTKSCRLFFIFYVLSGKSISSPPPGWGVGWGGDNIIDLDFIGLFFFPPLFLSKATARHYPFYSIVRKPQLRMLVK